MNESLLIKNVCINKVIKIFLNKNVKIIQLRLIYKIQHLEI